MFYILAFNLQEIQQKFLFSSWCPLIDISELKSPALSKGDAFGNSKFRPWKTGMTGRWGRRLVISIHTNKVGYIKIQNTHAW